MYREVCQRWKSEISSLRQRDQWKIQIIYFDSLFNGNFTQDLDNLTI